MGCQSSFCLRGNYVACKNVQIRNVCAFFLCGNASDQHPTAPYSPSAEEGSLQTVTAHCSAAGTPLCKYAAGRLSAALCAYVPFLFKMRALKYCKIHFSLNIVSASFSTSLTKPFEN